MLKIALCDDDKEILEYMKKRIMAALPDCEVEAFCSGEALLAAEQKFGAYFLDVQMQAPDGIQTARILKQRDDDTIIVFITGAREYLLDAFDVAALHYLLKPVSDDKLAEALNRVVKENARQSRLSGKETKQIFIKTRNKSVTLAVKDILYVENEMRKLIVHTAADTITFYGTMSELEKELGSGFYRCHRGYLANLAYVAQYSSDSITMTNGDCIYLSKGRYSDFVKQYMRYLRSGGAFHV